MKKLLLALLTLSSQSIVAKTMLKISVALEEQTQNYKQNLQVDRSFDITETKSVKHSDGNVSCNWEIFDETANSVSIRTKISETKNGIETEIAHPLLIVNRGEKGEIRIGDKKTSRSDDKNTSSERNLRVTVLVVEE